jgi:dCMP deaminase
MISSPNFLTKSRKDNSVLIAFVPVLHKGYITLFEKHRGDVLCILGEDILQDYTSIIRDLRVVDPLMMKQMIEALGIFSEVRVLPKAGLVTVESSISMPNEDISKDIAAKYFPTLEVTFENIFLRWDRPISTTEHVISPNRAITKNDLHRELITQAKTEADLSADFWRQVGAVIVKDGNIIAKSHNHHLPSDFHLVQNGDPRSNFDAGTNPDIYTSIHAEAAAVAECAKKGISFEGSSLYITTFPCPNCARLLCVSGIKKVYYEKGYSLLDAEKIFEAFGVEIILVQ